MKRIGKYAKRNVAPANRIGMLMIACILALGTVACTNDEGDPEFEILNPEEENQEEGVLQKSTLEKGHLQKGTPEDAHVQSKNQEEVPPGQD